MVPDSHTDDELYKFYLSLDAEKDAIIKQAETIKSIASEDNCVIVGRGNDTYKEAKKHVLDSDKSRSSYYEVISNQTWGNKENYDLCLNCEVGNETIIRVICDYVKSKNK